MGWPALSTSLSPLSCPFFPARKPPPVKLIADALIHLPYTLDFCAIGPNVEPLTCHLNGLDCLLWFPPSLSDDTDGQGVFGDWAWWTGKTLRLVQQRDLAEPPDVEAVRASALATGNEVLRRFLNAYRWRFGRPEVYPVLIDSRVMTLHVEHDNGRREALPEPISAFFYQSLPSTPPLEASVNATTLPTLQDDVRAGTEPPMAGQLRLDAEWLDAQGEPERAALVRGLMSL